MRKTTALFLAITASCVALAQEQGVRTETSLNADWQTAFADSIGAHTGFERARYSTQKWQTVNVPHSWESYEGYRRLKHGNLHGYAWYRKTFTVGKRESGRRYFIFFEGVGSYATVWVNGQELGKHAGGRTTFTVDVTNALSFGGDNLLAVRADHPAEIRDLPWVCGGCSSAWGFSEGSQPIGIFRPVTLIATGDVRVEPFGLHVWNDEHISDKLASLHANVELKNYSSRTRSIAAVARLFSPDDSLVASLRQPLSLAANSVDTLSFLFDSIAHPQLWSPDAPQLYSVVVDLVADGDLTDHTSVSCGIRTLSWPAGRKGSDGRFFINGKPFFVNGVCEYEHNMGASHAFTEEQIYARVSQMRAAGFNAFREAHQPHNLRYGSYMDILGMPWWTQMSAQIWFDTPEFRSNFKALLREWVRERRNHPAVVLWGLQNESKLPEDFAKECVDIIRELDPTTSSQRKVTTCNGGVGTDWNVVQNWSGTYGGNPQAYARELSKQLLNGEYGAWRSMDLRTEGSFDQNGELSEDRFLQLMELKAQQAEAAKAYSCGHFQWLLSSHENPGRTQNGEGLRELDRIGPVNYKGLLTAWGEPTDAYFMYRARYTPQAEPMVYIPMHTWPDRWTTTGVKDSVVVYSNCDELELWCDTVMLGMQRRRKNQARFVFHHVNVNSEVLFALGMLNNSPTVVASDAVLLHHLPRSSYAEHIVATNGVANTTESIEGYTYLYRLNCGGPDYTDINGSTWHADVRKSLPETCGSR
ncbi:MAG: glycoside hydrolase family 2 protein, partial [Prevotellaceae bacterium]|nr:glycoside hydrolase family 2 protein [Prevotellaceae bacterium]